MTQRHEKYIQLNHGAHGITAPADSTSTEYDQYVDKALAEMPEGGITAKDESGTLKTQEGDGTTTTEPDSEPTA